MKKLLLFFIFIGYAQTSLPTTSRLEKMRRDKLTAALHAQATANTLRIQKEANKKQDIKQAFICAQTEETNARYQIEQKQRLPLTQALTNINDRRTRLLNQHRSLLRTYTYLNDPRYKQIWNELSMLRKITKMLETIN